MAKFKSINNSLNNILNEFHLESAYQERLIISSWREKVDGRIAAVTEPVSFENGSLALRANSLMWKEELNNNMDRLLDMVNKSFDQITIKEIQFV